MTKPRPLNDLQRALEDLDIFSSEMEKAPFACLMNLEVKGGRLLSVALPPLRKFVDIAQRVATLLSNGNDKGSEVLKKLQRSGALVKSYSALIEKLEDGDTHQRKFYADIKASIDRFNAAVERIDKPNKGLGGRMDRFLYGSRKEPIGLRLAKIELSVPAAVEICFPFQTKGAFERRKIAFRKHTQGENAEIEKISALCQTVMPPLLPPTQTLELYAMKAIASIERSELLSRAEARRLVYSSPCQVALLDEIQALSISQRLEPIPGETIVISNVFLRDARTSQYTIYQAGSCKLSTQSCQSGFPHPLQRHGLAFADALIPFCLHNSEQAKLFSTLFDMKTATAKDLLPKGRFAAKARNLLRIRKSLFNDQRITLLEKHYQLVMQICDDALGLSQERQNIIDDFFNFLSDHAAAFELLSEANAVAMNCCATKTQESLQQAYISGAFHPSTSHEVESLLSAALEKTTAQLFKQKCDARIEKYCYLLIDCFAASFRKIIQQYYSEIFGFTPAPFDFLTIKIQTALYLHLQEFLTEFSATSSEGEIASQLDRMLNDEIALFQASKCELLPSKAYSIVAELSSYYALPKL
jgi:hypothetical protein